MYFDISNPHPSFLVNEAFLDLESECYWRKIDKIQNEFLVRLPKSEEPEFYEFFSRICRERRNERR